MVAGILAFGSNGPAADTKPLPSPTALTQTFNDSTRTQLSTASCVPSDAYPRSNVTSKGPLAPGG